ncbi:MAG: bifunctional phosphoribosylaminoimidazolecarboxamide formyltransferase/IMP cyclohydrolase [Candidatus Bipolaricaulia bacterium]
MRRALISVSETRGLVELASGLVDLGVEILASTGTADRLEAEDVPVKRIETYTGHPEILSGRVKTLHPKIHAGILANRDDPDHLQELEAYGIKPIDLVVVNLYPFESNALPMAVDEAMEYVDIGGETLIRGAAKNHRHVGVVVDPDDYRSVLKEIQKGRGRLSGKTAERLARKAFSYVTRYNAVIYRYLEREPLPETLSWVATHRMMLRYGENPDQQAALYTDDKPEFTKLHGKELSYTNLLDIDAAVRITSSFERPIAVVVKHTNPCGLASATAIEEAFQRALATDPQSAFGGVIGVNRQLTTQVAEMIAENFFEVVVAPSYEREALKLLREKKGLRVIRSKPLRPSLELRSISYGLLVQTVGEAQENDSWRVVTQVRPTGAQLREMRFAWKVVGWVTSNAIVLTNEGGTIGIGAGQMSRVDAVRLALWKAGDRARGAMMASDAFFPFRDGIDLAAEAGVAGIVQVGGSIRDSEVIAAADEHGIPMVFTGRRVFRH